jgi:NAD(P)-dependent dehydrogenase (short-subunit alcohol dehydrogenase family)
MTMAGQVVVVTGGANGIGRAIAEGMASAGADVIIADRRDARPAAYELCRLGHPALGVDVDIADEDAVDELIRRVASEYGRVDVLVNNAGIFSSLTPAPFEQSSVADWQAILDVNVIGVFRCCRAVLPVMRAQHSGRIVNIASAAPFKGLPLLLHYVASKGAVVAMTRALARELGPDGILVNAVAPGFTATDAARSRGAAFDALLGPSVTTRALQREETPADIVGAVVFLAGADSSFVTGQTLVVDGGSYLH